MTPCFYPSDFPENSSDTIVLEDLKSALIIIDSNYIFYNIPFGNA